MCTAVHAGLGLRQISLDRSARADRVRVALSALSALGAVVITAALCGLRLA